MKFMIQINSRINALTNRPLMHHPQILLTIFGHFTLPRRMTHFITFLLLSLSYALLPSSHHWIPLDFSSFRFEHTDDDVIKFHHLCCLLMKQQIPHYDNSSRSPLRFIMESICLPRTLCVYVHNDDPVVFSNVINGHGKCMMMMMMTFMLGNLSIYSFQHANNKRCEKTES